MPSVSISLGSITDDIESGLGIHINLKTFSMGIHKTETTADGSATYYWKADTSLILLPVCILAAPLIVDSIPAIVTAGATGGTLIPAFAP